MKKLVCLIALLIFLSVSHACSSCSTETKGSGIEDAEEAYTYGRLMRAQALCDSLLLGDQFGSLDTWDLCRLSLLFMRLGEYSEEPEVNTAFAARCIRAAIERDSDSTRTYVQAMPVEDQARFMMLYTLSEASHDAPEEDTVQIYVYDMMP